MTVEHRDTQVLAITEPDGSITYVMHRQETATVDPQTGTRTFQTIRHLVPMSDGRLLDEPQALVKCSSCQSLTTTDHAVTCHQCGKASCQSCIQANPDGSTACRACLTGSFLQRVIAWLRPE